MSAEADAILEEAYRILTEEKEWCQGAIGRDSDDAPVDDASDTATAKSLCLLGALHLATRRLGPLGFAEAEVRVGDAIGEPYYTTYTRWNDLPSVTKEDVLLALKRARYDFGGDA